MSTERQFHTQQIHFLRTNISYADGVGKVYTLGAIPAGSQIVQALSGVYVTTVFNAGTTNVLDIGTTADDDLYATDLALGTKAFVAIDEAATATNVNAWYVSSATTLTATLALTGTAPTTGAGVVVIAYIPNI